MRQYKSRCLLAQSNKCYICAGGRSAIVEPVVIPFWKDTSMRLALLPKTAMGKWSVALSIAFIVLIWAKIEDSMPVPTFAIAVLGLAGSILAVTAVLKKKDRSVTFLLPILVGLVLVVWVAAELAFPH
jgi:hypothetical protein